VNFADFEGLKDSRDKDISHRCNFLSKTSKSFNCKLTVPQAIKLATSILSRAQILIDEEIPEGAVKLWNVGEGNGSLLCGMDPASKSTNRRGRRKTSTN
jgi:hypothetical protein